MHIPIRSLNTRPNMFWGGALPPKTPYFTARCRYAALRNGFAVRVIDSASLSVSFFENLKKAMKTHFVQNEKKKTGPEQAAAHGIGAFEGNNMQVRPSLCCPKMP